MSLPTKGIWGISKSYQDAKRLHDQDGCGLYYPDKWKKQLSTQLKAGKREMSQNILAEPYKEAAGRNFHDYVTAMRKEQASRQIQKAKKTRNSKAIK